MATSVSSKYLNEGTSLAGWPDQEVVGAGTGQDLHSQRGRQGREGGQDRDTWDSHDENGPPFVEMHFMRAAKPDQGADYKKPRKLN